jgi:hypothetical protein
VRRDRGHVEELIGAQAKYAEERGGNGCDAAADVCVQVVVDPVSEPQDAERGLLSPAAVELRDGRRPTLPDDIQPPPPVNGLQDPEREGARRSDRLAAQSSIP